MSIFDPLGLVCPTTVKGRVLVQDLWRIKTSWDEVISSKLCEKWQVWLEEVRNLDSLSIPRWYFKNLPPVKVELRVFVDASQEAFAAAVYLSQKFNDSYETMLVMARAKVAPLKPTTIPRLELQAAVLGCRLACCVEKDIGVPLVQRTFWSDSMTVLHWVKSEPKIYKQFVSNRVGEIQELTKPEEWKWVPSKQNPADISTRANRKLTPSLYEQWIYGPSFLSNGKIHWPKQPLSLQSKDTQEIKKEFVGLHMNKKLQVIDVTKFSSWEKLTRIMAWVLRYVDTLRLRIKSNDRKNLQTKMVSYASVNELQPQELKKAEELLLLTAQDESFEEEKQLLEKGKSLPKSSRIYTFSPFLDEKKIIRMLTRTCNSPEFGPDQKRPIILDGRSQTAKLIVKMEHEKCFHQGVETVMSKTRERFWILNLRGTVKKVKNKCMRCRIDNAKPKPPQMAPLPETRVTRVEHPFFFTGVDYFGPIEVTVGRRHEKRWGVIFTCLSTRAIHLEVAQSLNTESCIMAIQRFISRRPCPSEMFSDNGTNFVASEKELRNAVKLLNHAQIQRSSVKNGIKWNFIPPRAPHMGGCWERLVRSVKTALRTVMRCQYPKDEELQTFLVRVESIINSRPLTHVSVDPLDPEPLTPNHFLREGFRVPIDEDKLCKRQLSRVRTLLDSFWKRWVREYLPCLTQRCKWHVKTVPPKIGDLAVLVDENNTRSSWPIGRISSVYPGGDGQVRIVDITTSTGTYKRPLTKVAILS